ncbi:MAG TPA: c-type cytochrome, partial [Usitatibacter sp.]|nr:c-type cytochrome [Usitatibacter sp.]
AWRTPGCVPGVRPRVLLAALLLAGLPASAADAEAGKAKAEPCVACHGAGGKSDNPLYPSLAGQQPLYIQLQLIQFRDGRRKDPQMSPMAANLSDADAKALGEYFAAQKPKDPVPAKEADRIERGKAISSRLHCNSCHMPTFLGQQHIPRLASQHYDYLVKSLRGFKNNTRPDFDGLMIESAQPLNDNDILDVAAYLATLP